MLDENGEFTGLVAEGRRNQAVLSHEEAVWGSPRVGSSPGPMLTPVDVGRILRLDAEAVTRGSLRRQLPWMKLGNRLRMHPAALEEYLRRTGGLNDDAVVRQTDEEVALPLHGEGEALHGTGVQLKRGSPRRGGPTSSAGSRRTYRALPELLRDGGGVLGFQPAVEE
jgi:hypothetical protein